MSQKSSDPQAISFVSQPLKRDNPAVVKGEARSEVNTKGDFGAWSRWRV